MEILGGVERSSILKIMTWNILDEGCIDFVNPTEYYFDIPVDNLLMKNRYPIINRWLKIYNSDVIMLQEATRDVCRRLIADFTDYRVMPYTANEANTESAYGNVTMLKKGVFRSIKHKKYKFKKSNAAFSVTTAVRMSDGVRFAFINIHLDAYKATTRAAEAQTVINLVRAWCKGGSFCAVCAGDFNTDKVPVHKKFAAWTLTVDEAKSTYLCEDPMLDYIYIKGCGKLNVLVRKGKIDNKAAGKKNCMRYTIDHYGSDHHPVIATVSVSARFE